MNEIIKSNEKIIPIVFYFLDKKENIKAISTNNQFVSKIHQTDKFRIGYITKPPLKPLFI